MATLDGAGALESGVVGVCLGSDEPDDDLTRCAPAALCRCGSGDAGVLAQERGDSGLGPASTEDESAVELAAVPPPTGVGTARGERGEARSVPSICARGERGVPLSPLPDEGIPEIGWRRKRENLSRKGARRSQAPSAETATYGRFASPGSRCGLEATTGLFGDVGGDSAGSRT